MKLATVTCQKFPQGVAEDKPLLDALEQLDITNKIHAWNAQVDWLCFDACLLRSVWDYHQRTDEFNEWLNKTAETTVVINCPEIVRWNQNKKILSRIV